jgi:protein-S-isoprenylcysteine O-methyltransferase Ste14
VGLFSVAVGFQAYFAPEGINGGRGEEEKFIFRQRILAIILVYSMYLALFFIPFFDRCGIGVMSVSDAVRICGVVLSALGYALIFTSGLALGRQYSADVTIQKDHQLVTWGVYRFIRHPRYLGVIVLAVGVPLVFHSWIGLLACLYFTGLVLFRIKDEEIAMHKEFGAQWETYCHRSWRLIPYIY